LPAEPPPEAGPLAGVAYAYLQVALKYQTAFKNNDEPLAFVDASGTTTKVKSFGVRLKDKGPATFRDQVRVLFRQGTVFAVDLSAKTEPYQIVVAQMPPQATLAATLADLDRRTTAGSAAPLDEAAVLLVPTMCWRIGHHFPELEMKRIANAMPGSDGQRLAIVEQSITFQMDRRGAKVASRLQGMSTYENGVDHHADPNYFVFDRPYLVVLKKRGGPAFFALWVANAELLYPF
jgi:hypothetical protein